ncbi:MAG: hypothetical protein IPG68_12230 [Micrococcales bacterium]|nr:hypothetical protein [Micrococcales bacterium]
MRTLTKVLIAVLGLLAGMLAMVVPAQGADSVVSGTVSSGNGPVSSGRVEFYATCQDYYDDDSAASDDFSLATYSVTVPDGPYLVLIYPDDQPDAVMSWHNAKPGCAQADVVNVTGNPIVNLRAATGSHVSGTVQAPNGTVSRGALAFYTTCDEYYARPAWPGIFTGGAYSYYLPDGTYRVLFYPEQSEYPESFATKSWHSAKPSCSEAVTVTVEGDTPVNISVAAGKMVSGTVSTTTGPVVGGDVFFYASCQDFARGDYPGYSAITNGTYAATMPPGTYRVRIKPTSTGALESWHSAKATCETADTVTITTDGTVDLIAQSTVSPTATPTPTPTTSPTTAAGKQTVKKPPARLKKGKKVKLAKKTTQGTRVTWKSRSKAVCSVSSSTLKAKKKGTCKVRAKAPAVPGYLAYSRVFKVRIT